MKRYRIKCFIASVLQLIRVCFPFLQVIETLSKLSRTPIALGTGIRYVIAIGNGALMPLGGMLLGKVVRGSIVCVPH